MPKQKMPILVKMEMDCSDGKIGQTSVTLEFFKAKNNDSKLVTVNISKKAWEKLVNASDWCQDD